MIVKIKYVALLMLLIMLFSGIVSCKDDHRTLDWITIKKIEAHPVIGKDGVQMDWGHYWIEMEDENGNIESYGWYPSADTSDWGNIKGEKGVLNGLDPKKQYPSENDKKHDPKEGSSADEEFHPILKNSLTDQEVRNKIRDFANSYEGNWALFSRNCHTFVEELMKTVGLSDPNPLPEWLVPTVYAPSQPKKIVSPLLSPPTMDTSSNDNTEGSSILSGTERNPSVTVSSSSGAAGTWKVFLNVPLPSEYGGDSFTVYYTVTFNPDGTVNRPEQHYSKPGGSEWYAGASTGTWTQNGNSVIWNEDETTFMGTIDGNGMSVSADGVSLSAEKISGIEGSVETPTAGVGPLIDEGINGGGDW